MLQRVGLAQALLNDPEVIFLDEPMSGLDPIGRREVRDIILRLRDRGTTVFFSSHILGDAETLCSRVAILAQGKLIAAGSVAEMVPFRIRGWDLVVSGLAAAALSELAAAGAVTRQIADGRYHVLLPETVSLDTAMARITAVGGQMISVNPVRDTLEDFFMARVRETGGREVG
jgi:ABC-2 type transport system ATP-binding protein